MNRQLLSGLFVAASFLAGSSAVYAQAAAATPTKIATINVQDSVTRTQEGQKLLTDLQERYRPTSEKLEKLGKDVETLRAQLNKGANTMSEEARRNLTRDIQQKERDLQRESEDAQTEFNREQQEVLNEIYGKVKGVIQKFARDQGYALVLDVSSPQTPVVDAFNELDITSQIIQLYDKQYPQQAAAATGTPAAAKPAAQ